MLVFNALRILSVCAFCIYGYFCLLAYCEYVEGSKDRMILFIILAILFQPFFKISMGRILWNIVDVVVAGYLFFLIIRRK